MKLRNRELREAETRKQEETCRKTAPEISIWISNYVLIIARPCVHRLKFRKTGQGTSSVVSLKVPRFHTGWWKCSTFKQSRTLDDHLCYSQKTPFGSYRDEGMHYPWSEKSLMTTTGEFKSRPNRSGAGLKINWSTCK